MPEIELKNLRSIGQEGGRIVVDVAKPPTKKVTDDDILRVLEIITTHRPKMLVLGLSSFKRDPKVIAASP